MSKENTLVANDIVAADGEALRDDNNYTPSDIEVHRDAAHIRLRPGMYIGDTGTKGLHHLVYELVHNCVDEALAGYCRNIHVKVDVDGSVSVSDDGRGIPVDIHPEFGKSALELVMTTVGAGGKFDKGAYKVSAGLHGMGAKAVTALSEWTEAEVRRNGRVYRQEYERGKPITELKEIGAAEMSEVLCAYEPSAGFEHHKTSMAKWLRKRQLSVQPSRILLTHGGQHALADAQREQSRGGHAEVGEGGHGTAPCTHVAART